ncbi:hypothetical protein ACFLXJ_04285 [Chloroflexota bacterium]
MKDKSLSILLMALFGILSITALVLAWLRPMPDSERILTTFIGSAGLTGVLIRSLLLKSHLKTETEQVMVKAKPDN